MQFPRGCALLGARRGTALPARARGRTGEAAGFADRNASAFAKDTTSFSAGCIAPNSRRPTPEQPSEP